VPALSRTGKPIYDCLMMKRITIAVALFAGAANAQSAAPSLVGVWKVTEITGTNGQTVANPQPGLFIFTRNYYSVVQILGSDPRRETPPTASDADLVKIWRPFVAQAGTYEVSGSTFTTRPIAAKNPNRMRSDWRYTFSFKLEGDTLTLIEGPAGHQGITKLTRVE